MNERGWPYAAVAELTKAKGDLIGVRAGSGIVRPSPLLPGLDGL